LPGFFTDCLIPLHLHLLAFHHGYSVGNAIEFYNSCEETFAAELTLSFLELFA